jgi:hypothetical protein
MMNKQIKELWEQAAKTTQGDSWEAQTTFMENFAKSIVRECIKQVQKDENGPAYEAAGRIAEHFGIE